MSEHLMKVYEAQRLFYDREFAGYEEYKLENWRIAYFKRIFKALDINSGDYFLDVGAGGTGYTVIEAVRRKGCYSIGVDLSSQGMKKAHLFSRRTLGSKSTLCEFIVCSSTHLPFQEESFSKIASIAVLEHIPDDELVICEISKVCKLSGKFLICVPNTYKRSLPLLTLAKIRVDKLVGHLRNYKLEELVNRFALKGFVLVHAYYHAHFIKALQYLLHTLFPSLRENTSRLWWVFEKLDSKLYRIPTGSVFSIVMEKNSGCMDA